MATDSWAQAVDEQEAAAESVSLARIQCLYSQTLTKHNSLDLLKALLDLSLN